MSIEKIAAKAKELKEKGQSNREISQEMYLSQATVEWLLEKQASENSGEVKDLMIENAKKHEKFLEFEEAAEIYKRYGMDDDVIRVRKEARNKIEQNVVHGDQITKTEIKDSVINRSNVGAGSKSKSEDLRDAKALLDDGIIDDDEFKQMKKEILGR